MFARLLRSSGRLPVARPVLPHTGRRSFAQVADVPAVSESCLQSQGSHIDCSKEDDRPFKVPVSEDSFDTYHLDPPPYTVETTKNQLKQLYHDMIVIRSASSR